jgi:uncharacterized protein (TIGR02266 family)
MRIKLKYPDVETFIQKYAVNISRGGIFIATKTPKAVGTPLKFEFVLAAGDAGISVIRGEGQVLWTREFDPNQPSKAHGMGVKFTRLDAESQQIVDRALAFRAQQAQPAGEERRDEPSGVRPLPERRDEPSGARPLPEARETTKPTELPEVTKPTELPEVTKPTELPEALRQPELPETRPTPLAAQPMGRAPNEVTRPLPVNHGRTREDITRPITVEQAEAEVTRVKGPGTALEELEEIAREWGVDEQKIERVLKRQRPRMVEATAELERLLRKPQKPPVPSKAEALAGLRELLQKGAPALEPMLEMDRRQRAEGASAAGGENEPIKKAR